MPRTIHPQDLQPVQLDLAYMPDGWCTLQQVVLLPALPRREEIVHVLQSSTPDEMEENVERLSQWARSWRPSS